MGRRPEMHVSRKRMGLGVMLIGLPGLAAALWWSPMELFGPNAPPRRLEVDLSSRTLKVIDAGNVVRTYGVAVGRPGHPTPTGSFRTGGIDWNPSWTPPPTNWARNKKYQPPGAAANPMQGVKIY